MKRKGLLKRVFSKKVGNKFCERTFFGFPEGACPNSPISLWHPCTVGYSVMTDDSLNPERCTHRSGRGLECTVDSSPRPTGKEKQLYILSSRERTSTVFILTTNTTNAGTVHRTMYIITRISIFIRDRWLASSFGSR